MIHCRKVTYHSQHRCPPSPSSHCVGPRHPLPVASRTGESTYLRYQAQAARCASLSRRLGTQNHQGDAHWHSVPRPQGPETDHYANETNYKQFLFFYLDLQYLLPILADSPPQCFVHILPSPMRVYPARHSYHHAVQMLAPPGGSASTCAGQIVTLKNKRKENGVVARSVGFEKPETRLPDKGSNIITQPHHRPTDPCERLNSPLAAPPLSALDVRLSSSASRCLCRGVETMDMDADDNRGRTCLSVGGGDIPAALPPPSRAASLPACAGSDAAVVLRSLARRYHCCAGVDLSTVWADMDGRGVLRRVMPGTGRTCSLSSGTSTWPVLTL